jgi:hypothetical protein
MVSSNAKNIPLVPFNVDYVYVTIDCKDSDILEEISVCVKATIQKKPQRKKRNTQGDHPDLDTSTLTDYYNHEKPPKNLKNAIK